MCITDIYIDSSFCAVSMRIGVGSFRKGGNEAITKTPAFKDHQQAMETSLSVKDEQYVIKPNIRL